MAELIAVVGDSGSGKTTSIRNLDPSKTFIISTTGKRPGIKGAKKKYPDFTINRESKEMQGNFYTSSNIESIKKMMQIVNAKLPEVTVLIIDDFQYLQAFEAMARVDEKGYGKFTDMANTGDNLNPYYKIKTQGKMLDSVITLEGLFTYVLFTKVIKDDGENVEYKFVTNSDGTCTAKTPMGLFSDQLIDNDLDMVINRIKEYNENE